MIPLSKDQKLKHTIDGVTYKFHPPIGEIEEQLISATTDSDNEIFALTKSLYPKAEKELEAEYKGKRKPKKEAWNKLVEARILKLLPEDAVKADDKSAFKQNKSQIDLILCGWESKLEIPDYPTEGKPSDFLPLPLISKLVGWYNNQYSLTQEELKN